MVGPSLALDYTTAVTSDHTGAIDHFVVADHTGAANHTVAVASLVADHTVAVLFIDIAFSILILF